MSAGAIAVLVVTGLLIAAVAVYLIVIALTVRRITDTLGKVTFGVRAIAHRTEPIGPLVDDINTTLTGVAGALDGTIARVAAEPAGARNDA